MSCVKPKFHGSSFLVPNNNEDVESLTCYEETAGVLDVLRGCYEETAAVEFRLKA